MSDIDDLMDKDPLGLSNRDLEAIIAYHRNRRASEDAPRGRAKKASPEAKAQLSALVSGMVKTDSTSNPNPAPAGKGLRRV